MLMSGLTISSLKSFISHLTAISRNALPDADLE
jgi:hypothetical protein